MIPRNYFYGNDQNNDRLNHVLWFHSARNKPNILEFVNGIQVSTVDY